MPKDFWATHIEFVECSHILWETTKRPIVLVDKKSVTSFFSSKASQLSNACDKILQFYFKEGHIAGSVNTAARFPSRSEFKGTKKIPLKTWEDIQTTTFELSTSSSEVTNEQNFFYNQTDNENEPVEQVPQKKGQSGQDTKEWVSNEEPSSLRTTTKDFTKIDKHYVVLIE